MEVTVKIESKKIAELFITAIESGDPVTTAARGGWCNGVNLRKGGEPHDCWYADPALYDGEFEIEVVEVDDESTGHETKHTLSPEKIKAGLAVVAEKFGHLFSQITGDNIDAPCADIFLQCCCFGEEKYA